MRGDPNPPGTPEAMPADAGPDAIALIEVLRAERNEARASSRAKSDLLASVSHEIRNHLGGILGMSQAVLETRITPEQRAYLDVVLASSDTLMTLVNDLLDMARLETGRLTLDSSAFNLHNALESVIASFQPAAQRKSIDLELDVEDGTPAWIVADPGRLRQIVVNLVGNAVKFTDHGGVVVSVGAEATGEDAFLLHLTVEDTGPGVRPEDQGAIFEPYVQAGDGDRRGGTGLGLSIVANLVELMGGRTFIESELGKGSRFGVSLPVGAIDQSAMAGPRATASGLEGLPILVVSDLKQHRDSLVGTLQSAGFRPDAANDEHEAIEMLVSSAARDRQFAATVCDLQSGSFNLAEQVRDRHTFDAMHLIVVTHIGQRGDAARCRELNTAGYLTRPLPSADVLQAVRAVLSGPSPVDLSALVTRHWLRERRQHLHLLVADDSPTNRVVVSRLLETRGHSVSLAATGREAISQVSEHRFDLIFMDLDMPGLDGIQATRAIRAAEGADRVPIVGLTGAGIEADLDRALAAGMDSLISKPFQVHEISTAIEQLVTQAPSIA